MNVERRLLVKPDVYLLGKESKVLDLGNVGRKDNLFGKVIIIWITCKVSKLYWSYSSTIFHPIHIVIIRTQKLISYVLYCILLYSNKCREFNYMLVYYLIIIYMNLKYIYFYLL